MVRFELVKSRDSIECVASLAMTIWHEAYADLLEKAQRDYMIENFQSPKAITRQIEEGMEYFLLFYHGSVAGYIGLGVEEDSLLLSKIYLLKSMRNKGIFTEVISFSTLKARTKNRKSLRLYVNKYNPALKAYEARGFKRIGSVVKDIGQGYVMDDYCMELIIL